jgi:capsid portal protein
MKSGVMDLKDFRPIRLVSGVYKIIAKVLANRLRKVVEKIISKCLCER